MDKQIKNNKVSYTTNDDISLIVNGDCANNNNNANFNNDNNVNLDINAKNSDISNDLEVNFGDNQIDEKDSDIYDEYTVIDPYEICEFQPEVVTTEKVDSINIDTGDTLNEKVHNMSVALTKGRSGAIFLPFIVLGLPFLLIAICSLLVLSPLTAIVWSLLSINVYNLQKTPDNKVGFKNFFKSITDKTLISATAVYRIMTLFSTLLLFVPSLFVRLNYCMFPFILNDKRENGENPDMIDLFAESKKLMIGHKLEYLSLMLYALPSIILTALTLGIISIWSIPYLTALKANFYVSIKSKSLANTNNDVATPVK